MRFLVAFLTILVSCSFIETYPAPERFDIIEKTVSMNRFWKDRYKMRELAKRTVEIRFACNLNKSSGGIGSGVVVKKTNRRSYVVTADHIVDWFQENPQCEIVVQDYKGFSGFAKVNKRSKSSDITLLEVDEPIGSPAPLYHKPYLGQPITCVGFPVIPHHSGVNEMSITRGYISTLNVGKFMRVSADLYYGNSGGACFSNNGSIVGIVSYFIVGGFTIGQWDPPQVGQFFISDVKNIRKIFP